MQIPFYVYPRRLSLSLNQSRLALTSSSSQEWKFNSLENGHITSPTGNSQSRYSCLKTRTRNAFFRSAFWLIWFYIVSVVTQTQRGCDMLSLGLPLSLLSLNVNSRHPNRELYIFFHFFSQKISRVLLTSTFGARRSAFFFLFLSKITNDISHVYQWFW